MCCINIIGYRQNFQETASACLGHILTEQQLLHGSTVL